MPDRPKMMLRDRFETENGSIVQRACEAMRLDKEFRVLVLREGALPSRQHWRGKVTKIERLGDSFEIEVMRTH